MKKAFFFFTSIFVVSIAIGQTTTTSGAKGDSYKSPNVQNQYRNNYNNPDAGQSGYGYGDRTSSKAYNDRKINGSTKDQVHPSVREQERKTMEYNAGTKSTQSSGVEIRRTKSKDDK